jgi:hypothetical protein
MVTVCAWCQKYMGSKEPLANPVVSHGICRSCQDRQSVVEVPVVVVSPERAGKIPLLQALLHGAPDVAIVVDRRSRERRNGHKRSNGNGERMLPVEDVSEDRRGRDRRRGGALYVV